MKPQVKSFLDKLDNDAAFRERLMLSSKQERQRMLSGFLNGMSFEEFKNEIVECAKSVQLKSDELGNVSGGGDLSRSIGTLSGCILGIFVPGAGAIAASAGATVGDALGEAFCAFLKN